MIFGLDRKDHLTFASTEALPQASNTQGAFKDFVTSSIKECIAEDELLQTPNLSEGRGTPSFIEAARGAASSLTHQIYDEVANLIPPCLDLPKLSYSQADYESSPMEAREKFIAAGHQKIDQAFSTELAGCYTPENKSLNKMVTGTIPFPGALSSGSAVMRTGRIAATEASAIRGWTVGEPIVNRTAAGNVPKWSTIRARYWKNRAEWAKSTPSHKYGEGNVPRMEKGLAPQKFNSKTGNWESMELHHDPSQREGGLFDFIELWPEEHAAVDPLRQIGD